MALAQSQTVTCLCSREWHSLVKKKTYTWTPCAICRFRCTRIWLLERCIWTCSSHHLRLSRWTPWQEIQTLKMSWRRKKTAIRTALCKSTSHRSSSLAVVARSGANENYQMAKKSPKQASHHNLTHQGSRSSKRRRPRPSSNSTLVSKEPSY